MSRIGFWVRAIRAPFFQAAVIPVLVGAAVAYRHGSFSWLLLLITALANAAINSGTNLANDYYDHLSGNDWANLNPTPFSGGSRMIQDGLLKPDMVFKAALISFGVAVILGLYLIQIRGVVILILGLVGIILGFYYTAPPLKLGYRGVGEGIVFFMLGPLAVEGSYYVQTGSFSQAALTASVPVGLLVGAILYINQFPDYEPDKSVGKNHLVVLLGRKRASYGYVVIIGAVYLWILLAVLGGSMPWWTLLAMLPLPLGLFAVRTALLHYEDDKKIIPAMAATIQQHLLVGLLLTIGWVLSAHF